jgi:hypothetical protein
MKHQDKMRPKKETVECLSCDEEVFVGRNPKVGNFVTCHNCDETFQIIDIEPVLIDWPYDEDDYTDDEEGYFDDVYEEYDS